MYSSGSYFTVTGNRIPNTPYSINENQETVNALYNKWFAEDNKVGYYWQATAIYITAS
jgi:primase-polymerase (primpol)-like protein